MSKKTKTAKATARTHRAANTSAPAKARRASAKATPAKAGSGGSGAPAKRRSALDAAAIVLAKVKKPMNVKDIVEAMAVTGLWKSPGGKTPSATLYAAMHREIKTKGKAARFRKVERGMFEATSR